MAEHRTTTRAGVVPERERARRGLTWRRERHPADTPADSTARRTPRRLVTALAGALTLTIAGAPAVAFAHGRSSGGDQAPDQAVGAGLRSWTDVDATDSTTPYLPKRDPYSMYNVTKDLGAQRWWYDGYTGEGVDVAIIDTGVAPVRGLDAPGKIVNGPDLSLESQAPNLEHLDTNGHGTFMAGIIAGNDAGMLTRRGRIRPRDFRGVAPDARILSVKVATADGGVDVSQVIAAIDWVVQHRNDDGLNVRVLNLSYTVASAQAWEVDPLSYAAEQAWKHGIVVVAAAGNTSNTGNGLASPAYNPHLIAVGSYDDNGTPQRYDDFVAAYSATSSACVTACRAPDLVAMGSHLQGLRVPGSYADLTYPEGRLDDRYFRGSGTSEAAAIVSGAVALVLQKYPWLTPDQVKDFLMRTTSKVPDAAELAQGAGIVDLHRATRNRPRDYAQDLPDGVGGGSLELARGDERISMDGIALAGEQDIFGAPFDSAAHATLEAGATAWDGGTWNGSSWSGSSWSGSSWSGSSWSGSSWSGSSWSGSSWSGSSWSGSSWSGSSWSGSSWSGSSWSGSSWSGSVWSSAAWD